MPAQAACALLRCPVDGGELRPVRIADGEGVACGRCSAEYPWVDGVLRFLGADRRASVDDPVKIAEIRARDRDSAGYVKSSTRTRSELPAYLSLLDLSASDVLVEIGCGVGRIGVHTAARVSRYVGVDFSFESLRVFARSLSPALRRRVLLVEADLAQAPLARGAFTVVSSFQVFEHVPTAEGRAAAFRDAVALMAPRGRFVFSVYNWSGWKRRLAARGVGDNTRKEGFHDTGVYYYNFEREEILALCEQAGLTLDELQGLLVPYPGARFLAPLSRPIESVLRATSYGLREGHLLLASGRRPVGEP